jgi:hypothetical protein
MSASVHQLLLEPTTHLNGIKERFSLSLTIREMQFHAFVFDIRKKHKAQKKVWKNKTIGKEVNL